MRQASPKALQSEETVSTCWAAGGITSGASLLIQETAWITKKGIGSF
jgi:hypothetical protein